MLVLETVIMHIIPRIHVTYKAYDLNYNNCLNNSVQFEQHNCMCRMLVRTHSSIDGRHYYRFMENVSACEALENGKHF